MTKIVTVGACPFECSLGIDNSNTTTEEPEQFLSARVLLMILPIPETRNQLILRQWKANKPALCTQPHTFFPPLMDLLCNYVITIANDQLLQNEPARCFVFLQCFARTRTLHTPLLLLCDLPCTNGTNHTNTALTARRTPRTSPAIVARLSVSTRRSARACLFICILHRLLHPTALPCNVCHEFCYFWWIWLQTH